MAKIYIGKDCSRRDFLRFGATAVTSLALPAALINRAFAADDARGADSLRAIAQAAKKANPKAKCIIQVWLGGGPCHVDTFDPKPLASADIQGPYKKPIATNVDGIIIGQKFPSLAKCADKYSILRGINHNVFAHETATYLMQTGIPVGGELVYPSVGAVICALRQPNAGASVPSFISVMNPIGRFEESGFLGSGAKSFSASGVVSGRDLFYPRPPEDKSSAEKKAAALKKISSRRELLKALDDVENSLSPELEKMDSFRAQAYSILSGAGREAFDLTKEKDSVRELYGKYSICQELLLARRLAEAGATYILVNWGGWDTHKRHFEAMERMLPQLDTALAALITDLSERGMLDTTLVLCGGEFSRTPRIMYAPPWFGGRNHYGDAGSWIVAGGGLKGGAVVGATDKNGFKVVERPIYPWDFSATVYTLAGVDHTGQLPHPLGCAAYITPPEIRTRPSGGILREIMKS